MTDQDYRNMVDELCDVETGLSAAEIQFVDSLVEWDGSYTPRQKAWLQKIYDRVL